jgi:hypothetical protein
MAGRSRHIFYTFISNKNAEYYSCVYSPLGEPIISKSGSPVPLKYSPADLQSMSPEFATNRSYFSLNRSITNPFKFIKDGASILRYLDYNGKGFEEKAFLTIVKYNSARGIYELYYTGRLDFSKKIDDPISGFTINTVDSGVWGTLSQLDDVQVQIPCSSINPKAIKVLFDGITLQARYYYQPVATQIRAQMYHQYLIIPLVQTVTDGDSYGIITQGQDYDISNEDLDDYVTNHPSVYFFQSKYATTVHIDASYEFDITEYSAPANARTPFTIQFAVWRSTQAGNIGDYPVLFRKSYPTGLYGVHDKITFSINQDYNLAEGEKLLLVCRVAQTDTSGNATYLQLTPTLTNMVVSTDTKIVSTTAYALRPLDLAQQIVSKLTGGLFTLHSNFYSSNNKVVCTCGDALRGEPLALLQTTFKDWFDSYDSGDFIAGRIIDGELWIEQANEVYKEDGEILDLGEVTDLTIQHDTDRLLSNFEIGSPEQDYRHSSGRYEFNSRTAFSFEVSTIKNTLSLISKYRRDCYGIEFLRLDYFAGNTKDNKGDKEVFMVDITDELGQGTIYFSNYKIYQVNSTPLAPQIVTPITDDDITNQFPTIRGFAPSGKTVNIYVDTVLDGSVIAAADNTWSYDIVTQLDALVVVNNNVVTNGIHTVEATFTDLTGSVASVTFTVLTGITPTSVVYPADKDTIIDSKPLIRGRAQAGLVLNVSIGAVNIGSVTVDGSCWWSIQSPPISNGIHTLQVDALTTIFTTNVNTAVPIILRPTEEFDIINNLPLIEGVATPGATINLYLDYYDKTLGSDIADGNGNWSIQIAPMNKDDGTILTPIPNGQHILSTGLTIQNTTVESTGYKLNRPNYDSITGVLDNTVFNVELSPKRMLLARSSYWASLMLQNQDTYIRYGGNDKNQALSTVLGNEFVKESEDVPISNLDANLFVPIKATFKTKVPDTFNSVFDFFNNGGNIRASFQGNEIWFLPMGKMSVNDVINSTQSWSLLFAAKTPLSTILNLSRQGLTLNLMKNAIHHSDYNSLHFVKYNYSIDAHYHAKELYDDWFDARNDRWVHNPVYIQKFQTNDYIRDQVITNNVSALTLNMYRCGDAIVVATFVYNPVSPSPIPSPDIVREAEVDFSMYPPDQYFFVMMSGSTPVAISERIQTAVDLFETILIETTNSSNLTGFMYSTGIISKVRIEGLVQKWQPNISILTDTDEVGDNQTLHSVYSRQRKILLGKASGLPDYLYLKISALVILDNLKIEGINYVADNENKLTEQDRILGHPMYHYELTVQLANNEQGIVFDAGVGLADVTSVVITVDAEAFGTGGSQLVDIELKGE